MLVTLFSKKKFNDLMINDLTPNYQTYYNKNAFNTFTQKYYSGRAQIFNIKNLILVNVHAPGDPNNSTQKNYYQGLTSFIRCKCMSNQEVNCSDYNNVIFIGDFNVSKTESIKEWSNSNNFQPEFILYNDEQNRNTSYHSGIKDEKGVWNPDPNLYQKVDHLMYTNNITINNLKVYASYNDKDKIDNKFIPYTRDPPLPTGKRRLKT